MFYRVFDTYRELQHWYNCNCLSCSKQSSCSVLRNIKELSGFVTKANKDKIHKNKKCDMHTIERKEREPKSILVDEDQLPLPFKEVLK